jgi:integrase
VLRLFLRGRSYSARFLVPVTLRAMIKRREIWTALGTRSHSAAKLRAGRVAGNVSRLFSLLLGRGGHRMDKAEIDLLIRRWTAAALEEGEVERATSGPLSEAKLDDISTGLGIALEAAHEELVGCDYSRVTGEVDELLATHKLPPLDHQSEAFKRLARELLRAKRDVLRTELDRWQGDYTTGNGSLLQNHQGSTAEGPQFDALPLSEAIPLYLKHFEDRAPGTIEAKQNALRRFLGVVNNKPVHTIAKADCILYRDTLRKLPANLSKRFPGRTINEALALVAHKPGKSGALLSKNTINQDLMHIGHFFGWLIAEGKRGKDNPVDGLAFDGVEAKSHETFSDKDISTIFTSTKYKAQLWDKEYARYFLPLILLYSGARREEVANLALPDIQKEGSVYFMDLAPDPTRGRRLKNKASRRRVPIHSHLIELGFIDYVEWMRAKGETLLFPKDKRKKGRATMGDAVSKWFARTVKGLKIPGKKTLHGFRPTVATRLYEVGVDGETRRELLGHSGKDVHEQVYLRPPLAMLSGHLEKMDFRPLLKGLPVYHAS